MSNNKKIYMFDYDNIQKEIKIFHYFLVKATCLQLPDPAFYKGKNVYIELEYDNYINSIKNHLKEKEFPEYMKLEITSLATETFKALSINCNREPNKIIVKYIKVKKFINEKQCKSLWELDGFDGFDYRLLVDRDEIVNVLLF